MNNENIGPRLQVAGQLTREQLREELAALLDRQRLLRSAGHHFDERARLQTEIHAARAGLGQRAERIRPGSPNMRRRP